MYTELQIYANLYATLCTELLIYADLYASNMMMQSEAEKCCICEIDPKHASFEFGNFSVSDLYKFLSIEQSVEIAVAFDRHR